VFVEPDPITGTGLFSQTSIGAFYSPRTRLVQ